MRPSMALLLCGLVLLVSGWTSGPHQGPPTCSPGDLRTAVQTPGTSGTALYTRWCGPARARVLFNGTSFLIRGGRCLSDSRRFFVRVGLIANPPARPANWVGLFIHQAAQAGTFRLGDTATSFVYATIQLGGPTLDIAAGTITIGRSTRAGTFALRLRDATRLTGSFTCG